MYESLGNKLLAEANGFGSEIAERIMVERSWPSQSQVTVAHDLVEGNKDCHLIKSRLPSGEPVMRIEGASVWEARLQDGWVFRGLLEGKKVVTRKGDTFIKKLSEVHSSAFVQMVENCMLDLIEAHQSAKTPIHETTERYGPYHLPMTEAFLGYDMPESDLTEAKKMDFEKAIILMRNDRKHKDILIKLKNNAMKYFDTYYKRSDSDVRKGEEIEQALNRKLEKREAELGLKRAKNGMMYYAESDESGEPLTEGTSPLERKMLRNSKEGHYINKGAAFNVLRKKGLLDDSGVLTQAGELEIAESAISAELSEGKLTRRDIKVGSVLVNKNTGNEVKVSGLRKASHVRGGYAVSLADKKRNREDNLDMAQVLKSYDLKESDESAEISEFKAPVEIPFGAIADFQGKEYKKIQLTDKPMWRLVVKSGVRQKELGSDIAKGDKNYTSIEKRAKMQLRSKKLFDPKKMPSEIRQKYRKLSIKLLKAPLAMKRKYQSQIDNLISGVQAKKNFTPLTDADLSEGKRYDYRRKGINKGPEILKMLDKAGYDVEIKKSGKDFLLWAGDPAFNPIEVFVTKEQILSIKDGLSKNNRTAKRDLKKYNLESEQDISEAKVNIDDIKTNEISKGKYGLEVKVGDTYVRINNGGKGFRDSQLEREKKKFFKKLNDAYKKKYKKGDVVSGMGGIFKVTKVYPNGHIDAQSFEPDNEYSDGRPAKIRQKASPYYFEPYKRTSGW